MKEFDINRIGFTVALIASSFALYPMLKDIKNVIPIFFQPSFIDLKTAYWIFNIGLGIAIYLYAFSYVGTNSNLTRTKMLGDCVFRVSISFPFIYFIYFFGCYLNYFSKVHNVHQAYPFKIYDSDTYNYLVAIFLFIFSISNWIVVLDLYDNAKENKKKSNRQIINT